MTPNEPSVLAATKRRMEMVEERHAALLRWAERAAEALRDLGACDDPNCNEPNCLKVLAEFDVLREGS